MRQYKWLEDDLSKVGFDPFGWNVKIWQSAMIEDGQKINDGINWIEKCGQKLPIPKGGQKFDPLGCHIRPPPHVLHQ